MVVEWKRSGAAGREWTSPGGGSCSTAVPNPGGGAAVGISRLRSGSFRCLVAGVECSTRPLHSGTDDRGSEAPPDGRSDGWNGSETGAGVGVSAGRLRRWPGRPPAKDGRLTIRPVVIGPHFRATNGVRVVVWRNDRGSGVTRAIFTLFMLVRGGALLSWSSRVVFPGLRQHPQRVAPTRFQFEIPPSLPFPAGGWSAPRRHSRPLPTVSPTAPSEETITSFIDARRGRGEPET